LQIELKLGFTFMGRNGMGPIPIIPPQTNMESDHITKAHELRNLLSNFTAAEEVAVHQIAPTLSIVRLSQGSLASKGNTSCVWHKSRLTRILPNLPAECKFIVVKHISNNNSHTSIKSTKFWRENIQRALYLLKNTGLDEWSIEIIQLHFAAWPEEGNFIDMDLDINVTEADDDGNKVLAEEQVPAAMLNNASSVHTSNEGHDAGPAPLQNSEIPEESFEGVLNVHDRSNVTIGQASLVENAVQEAVQRIQQKPDSEVLNGTNIHTT
jgi:hypothetical protein